MSKILEIDNKRVISDIDLGRIMGHKFPSAIRTDIEAQKAELGDVLFSIINPRRAYDKTRDMKAYYLTEPQALALCGGNRKARKKIGNLFNPPAPKQAPKIQPTDSASGHLTVTHQHDGLCLVQGLMSINVAAQLVQAFQGLTK